MSDNWVDFKEIKSKISMEMVLGHYDLLKKLKNSGPNLVGCCPLHNGSNPRHFSVNLERNIFNCFGNCKSGGNILDFVSKMEGVNVREAALLLKNWFLESSTNSCGGKESNEDKKQDSEEVIPPEKTQGINPPLEFKLKALNPEHKFFNDRKINKETINYFGLGYCSKGIMKGYIAIPIHDENDQLVAYCGQALTAEQINRHGKYKMPSGFMKSAVVYNLDRQKQDENLLILVENFISVWRLHQEGFSNTVALMGSCLGKNQKEQIINTLGPDGKIVLLFGSDKERQNSARECVAELSKEIFVKAIDIRPYARKPHQLTREQIKNLI